MRIGLRPPEAARIHHPQVAEGIVVLHRIERIEPAQAGKRRDPLSLIYLLGLLVLSGALAFLWLNPPVPDVVAEDTTRLDALELRVQTLTAQVSQTADRVVQVEQRPALPAPGVVVPDPIVVVDLAPLEGRLAALEARSAPGASALGADLRPLEERLAALEARPAVGATGATPAPAADLRPLEERLAALEARPVPQMPPPPDLRPLEERLAAVEARPLPEPFPPQGTFTDLMTVSTRLDAVAARQDALAARQTAERAELIAPANVARMDAPSAGTWLKSLPVRRMAWGRMSVRRRARREAPRSTCSAVCRKLPTSITRPMCARTPNLSERAARARSGRPKPASRRPTYHAMKQVESSCPVTQTTIAVFTVSPSANANAALTSTGMPRPRRSIFRKPASAHESLSHWHICRPAIAAGCTGTSSTSGRDEMTIPPGCWEMWRGRPAISPDRSTGTMFG